MGCRSCYGDQKPSAFKAEFDKNQTLMGLVLGGRLNNPSAHTPMLCKWRLKIEEHRF